MMEFKIEEKYLVIKKSDLDEFLSHYSSGATDRRDYLPGHIEAIDRLSFREVLNGIAALRTKHGKNPHPRYWVCNQDEPYADMIIRLIELGEKSKS